MPWCDHLINYNYKTSRVVEKFACGRDAHTVHDVPRDPQVISHLDALTRPHLKLPLGRHHFSVASSDLHASVQAAAIVRLHNVSPVHLVSADTTVVGALGTRESVLRPAKRMTVVVEEGVLLLNAEPRSFTLGSLHCFIAGFALVHLCRFVVVVVDLAENQFVLALPEGISEKGDRVEVHIRVVAFALSGTEDKGRQNII